MAIAGAQRKQVLKVLMISLLLDLVRVPCLLIVIPLPILTHETRFPLHSFYHSFRRYCPSIVLRTHRQIPS